MRTLPKALLDLDIIVGGMGADISSVELVGAVASHPCGRMSGSLSAVALADIYARRLQLGDVGGEIRRAFDAFVKVVPTLTKDIDRLYKTYYIQGGKSASALFRGLSMKGLEPPRDVQILTIAATFSHIWRTKRLAPGRPVGINFLRKIERVMVYGLYGAMLAGADWIVVGAGDPSDIPGLLDKLAAHEAVELPMQVATVPLGTYKIRFDPKDIVGPDLPPPPRPAFLAIISSHLQAQGLASSPRTRPEGFVVEGPLAGGHNAPPQKKMKDARGYYVYGPEDDADLGVVAEVGLPFWVAGGRGQPLKPSTAEGPLRGRQIGTIFALSDASGMAPALRRQALELIWHQQLEVVTDVRASPSTFPFKVALLPGSMADPAVYAARKRVCNVGQLRSWRPMEEMTGLCPASDPALYKKRGGAAWRTDGAMCLCNGLLATCGLPQPGEQGLVTLGDITPVRELQRRLRKIEYSTQEAIAYLRGEL
ncbi:MAG TPA: 2-nitropropane dioxygenase [Elusimicrobia bacterium]|nr:2-nitropropane dioxygenase [Elusimicrobiota bacterium]